jgi:hypothetical protein
MKQLLLDLFAAACWLAMVVCLTLWDVALTP